MALPPFQNAKGEWVIDLPSDRVSVRVDGVYIDLTTEDLKPGGALYGLNAKAKGTIELRLRSRPEIDTRSAKFGLHLPANPDPLDEELVHEWHTAFQRGEGGLGGLLERSYAATAEADTAIAAGERSKHTVSLHARAMRPGFGRTVPAQPTLSDDLMFAKDTFLNSVPRKMQEAVKAAHRQSRAFVFDEAASYRVGELTSYMPDLIADQQEFARCPYPRTWIEFDGNALLRAMKDAGQDVYEDTIQPDERFGFLITERGIYTAASNASMPPFWSPIVYRPHQPMTLGQEERICHDMGISRIQIDQFLWGNAYDLLDPSRRRSLRTNHGMDFLFPEEVMARNPGGLMPMLKGAGAGDLKVALCAMLLLIRPNLTHVVETREPMRRMHLGRPTVFIAHRVVTVKLTPDRLVSRIRRACKEERGRARARWHEVRGHYMHNHAAKVAHCTHDWEQVEPLKWQCRKGCGGRRAWRTYPEGRGSAEVGVVTKHYEVKP